MPCKAVEVEVHKLPTSTRLVGKGVFKTSCADAEADFEIVWNTQYATVITDTLPTAVAFAKTAPGHDSWSLSGKLSDGRPISSDGMILNHMTVGEPLSRAEFDPTAGLEIGCWHADQPSSVRHGLVGLFEGTLDACIDGWEITLRDPLEDAKAISRLSRAWGIPLEGLVLSLFHASARLDEYSEKVSAISRLLSLAVGNGVAAHKRVVEWPNHEPYESWRHQTGDKLGPGRVYPLMDFSGYLEQVLPAWESWSQEKRDTFRLALEYINLSHTGYLDTRIFQIMQAWEFVAAAWGPKGVLTEPETKLKTLAKQTCKDWRTAHPKADQHGLWSDRLLFPFRWQLAKDSIRRYASSRSLDLDLHRVDLDLLKRARDTVAHTGRLPDEMRSDTRETLHLLIRAQNAMQLVLLLELGYRGKAFMRGLSVRELVDLPITP